VEECKLHNKFKFTEFYLFKISLSLNFVHLGFISFIIRASPFFRTASVTKGELQLIVNQVLLILAITLMQWPDGGMIIATTVIPYGNMETFEVIRGETSCEDELKFTM
jgi:hypothetical protein